LITAIRHQNLIGWDNFLRGFTSSYWDALHHKVHLNDPTPNLNSRWDMQLVAESITLSQHIWADRNSHIHGASQTESRQLLRERVMEQVRHIYKHPPRLYPRFKPINNIPLKLRLSRATTNLQCWHALNTKKVCPDL
jgi:hypothetical protein